MPDTRRHPVFARFFARFSTGYLTMVNPHRPAMLAGLAGQVLEIGAGNGLNFAHYPATVTKVLAVEPEPYMRDLARSAAAQAPVPIEVVPGTADALPAPDASLDGAVASLVLCSVPDQAKAIAELYRVLRPGGELRFLEHVLAETPGLARAQRAADLVWPLLYGGCHPSRDTLGAIIAAGFEITAARRFFLPDRVPRKPDSPFVLGVARRPG